MRRHRATRTRSRTRLLAERPVLDRLHTLYAAMIVASLASVLAAQSANTKQPAPSKTEGAASSAPEDALPAEEKLRRLRLRQIVEGIRNNKASFKSGKWRIVTVTGTAESMESAFAGKWRDRRQSPVEVTHFIRDDMHVRRTVPDEQNFAKKGRFAIQQSGVVAILYSPKHFVFDDAYHPIDEMTLSGDFPNPASVLATAAARGYADGQLTQEPVTRDGVENVLLRKRGGSDTQYDIDFYIDRRRGYLPITTDCFIRSTGVLVARLRLLEIRQEGAAWFPMHSVLVVLRTNPDGRHTPLVHETKVAELDLTKVPTDAELAIEVPKSVQYRNQGNGSSAQSLFDDGVQGTVTVLANDIEGIHQKLEGIAAERKRTEPAGAAICAFGWLFSSMQDGHIRFAQFAGRTEPGQLIYLAANGLVQQDLRLSADEKTKIRNFVKKFETDLFAEMQPQGLSRAAVEAIYSIGQEDRSAQLRSINQKARVLERKFCDRRIATLQELLTPQQLRRLKEIRMQVVGSRGMTDTELVETLGLTDEQQRRIAAINVEYDDQLIAYFSTDFTALPDTDTPIFQVLMTHVAEMSRERDELATAVLSPEQREQLGRLQGMRVDLSGERIEAIPAR